MKISNYNKGSIITKILLLLASTLLLASCDEPLPPITWEGNNIRFGTTYDYLPCGQTLERLDRRVSETEDDLRVTMPKGKKISYYWLDKKSLEDLTSCPSGSGGCMHYEDGEIKIFALEPFEVHEIVHAVVNYAVGRAPPIFEEGLAVGISEFAGVYHCPSHETADTVLEQLRDPPDNLDIEDIYASHYIRYLIDKYGMDKFIKVYERLSNDSILSEIQATYQDVFGATVPETLDKWVQDSPCCWEGWYATRLNTIDAKQGSDGPSWQFHIDLNCGSETVSWQYGSYGLFSINNIVITEEGQYTIELETSSDFEGLIQFIDCGDCDNQSSVDNESGLGFLENTPQAQLYLTPSTYCFIAYDDVMFSDGDARKFDGSVDILVTENRTLP